MKPLKKGPQIKLSELKVPQVLSDLYWDLRDRYLLPAVVVLVIAIAAVPLALGGSSNSSWEDAVADGSVADELATSSAVPASGELVAKAAPGLRDYRRRLRDLQEKDPFAQQFSGGSGGGSTSATGNEVSTGGSATSSDGSTSSPETSTPGFTEESPPAEPTPDSPELTWFSYALDVRVVSLGEAGGASASGANESNVSVRHNLPELTVLPSREVPAAIYMGVTKDGKKALMMISDQVQGIFGDGTCVLGSTSCQLLAMEPGLPVTFVYGPRERTFRIEILKLRLLNTDHLNRAPLGSDKDKRKKSAEGLALLTPRP
jgi:hypothetical protein